MGVNKRENEKEKQQEQTKKIINISVVVIIIIALVIISVILNKKDMRGSGNSDKSQTGGYTYNLSASEKELEDKFLLSDKPVLVDYYADWCPPCVMMAPIIQELELERDDFYVMKVNIDENRNLADKAGVSSIPYFVLYNDGEFISSTTGFQTKESLIEFVTSKIKK